MSGTEITSFSGRYAFLSNFHPVPIRIMIGAEWVKCATVEHAYQASKTLNKRWRTKIVECPTPGAAKRMGNRIEKVCYWEDVKTIVMLELLRQKFTRAAFRQALLRTGSAKIIEGNTWHDNFWGSCECVGCSSHEGQNQLGRLLERIRTDVRSGSKSYTTRTRL